MTTRRWRNEINLKLEIRLFVMEIMMLMFWVITQTKWLKFDYGVAQDMWAIHVYMKII
jgi:hypothetical protein